ncbi:MAG: AAA family ATPase [Candidatus Gracilibacteria bacterium]|nr:AAA family ATPase [Candidatus Gracilibacteria bacterium]
MFIKELKVKNFKCFNGELVQFCIPNGTEGSGLNILVGENNSGKSSILEAVYFLRNKTKKDFKRLNTEGEQEFFVELTFTGEDIENVIDDFAQDNKKEAFKKCIHENEGEKIFAVKRSFKDDEEIKKILFLKEGTYENISGIDGSFQAFFQISNIWANTNPEDETRFGSATICGNLLSDISDKFKVNHKDQYNKFLDIFDTTFNSDTSGLQKELNDVASETETILNDQFGKAKLRFQFENPEPSILFKNIKIFVNDGQETDINQKGHGLQRAVVLSLLQVYAQRMSQSMNEEGEAIKKPHFLFIDEPELGLHPQAQKKLFNALKILSKNHQVFISTHSENFIASKLVKNIIKYRKNDDNTSNSFSINKSSIDLNLKENRKFFYHHHKLFFTKKAIFVEGVDDYDRYPVFCEDNGFNELRKDFYLLAGCSDYSPFKDLCTKFGIKSFFLFDIDVLSKTNNALKNYSSEIWQKIQKLNIETTKKNPTTLLDENITAEQKKLKYEIISDLQKDNIVVLSNGAIEQYISDDFQVSDDAKREELLNIFKYIEKN